VLQHELQHLLDFADGSLTPLGYLLLPRNWTYRWNLADLEWRRLGAEQRASIVEMLWRAEHVPGGDVAAMTLRKVIPWANASCGRSPLG
jgi:hypothetical protein